MSVCPFMIDRGLNGCVISNVVTDTSLFKEDTLI